jgi:TonB family protein
MPFSSAKVLAVNAPRPEYPYEARRQKITGDGLVVMTVDPADGNVTSVSMSKTTGSPFLDNAAIAGFKRWRFKPGTVSSVTCPVTFTLTGASY